MKIGRFAAVLAFCCLLLMPSAHAAVSLDACEASPPSWAGAGPFTDSSFTVPVGSNQLLVFMFAEGNAAAVPSVTWDGVAMTNVSSQTNGATGAFVAVLVAPHQGNKSLVISLSPNFTQFSNSVLCSFSGVDQTTPTQNANSTTTSSLPITTVSGNETVATAVSSGSLSSFSNTAIYLNGTNATAASRNDSAGTSTTYTLTGSGTLSISGIDIRAGGGGGAFAAPPCPFIICTR